MSGLCWHVRSCWCPWSMLLLRIMSGFVVLLQAGVTLIPLVHVTTKGHVNVCDLCCHQGPWLSVVLLQLGTMLMLMANVTIKGHVDIRVPCCCLKPCWCEWPALPPETRWCLCYVLMPRAIMVSVIPCAVFEWCVDILVLYCHWRSFFGKYWCLRPCGTLWSMLLLIVKGREAIFAMMTAHSQLRKRDIEGLYDNFSPLPIKVTA